MGQTAANQLEIRVIEQNGVDEPGALPGGGELPVQGGGVLITVNHCSVLQVAGKGGVPQKLGVGLHNILNIWVQGGGAQLQLLLHNVVALGLHGTGQNRK